MIGAFFLWLVSLIPHTVIYRTAGCPYMTRYYLLGGPRKGWRKLLPFNLYLQFFHESDYSKDLHNHPWAWAYSLILKGGYWEERKYSDHWLAPPGGYFALRGNTQKDLHWVHVRKLTPGSVNVLDADDFHRVDLLDERAGCWTLFLAGPQVQRWGFEERDTGWFRPHAQKAI